MKTITEMACEARLERGGYWEFDLIRLKHFAELVRADEKEACAKAAEEHMREREGISFGVGAAIRARGSA